jgi:hypothetical protein
MPDFDFTGYMRDVAINLKDIGHIENDDANKRFYRVSSLTAIEEIITSLSILNEFVLVVEDNAEGGLMDANSIMDRQICSWFLLKKVELNDAEAREQAKKQCKATMIKILKRLRRDYISDNKGETNIGLRNAEFDRWTYTTFGPILDNCIGIHVAFTNPNTLNTVYDGNDWLDG